MGILRNPARSNDHQRRSLMYNIVNNPIPTSKLFVTPKDEQDLYDRIERLSGAEKALAFQIAMMTFNLCNQLVEDNILSKEIFAQ
jgi:hypothetical protein